MKNVIDLNPPKYVVNNPVTDQWLARNLDNNKLEWVRLTPRNSNYQTSFTEKEIREINYTLMEYATPEENEGL